VLCGHGSRHEETEREFIGFFKKTARLVHPASLDYAFLEFNQPAISKKLEELYQNGYRKFSLVPIMLSSGAHVNEDIPEILGEFLKHNPKAKGAVASNFGEDERVIALATARVESVIAKHNLPRKDTALLIVGRGNKNQELNKMVQQIGKSIEISCKLVKSAACFCGMSTPTSEEGLQAMTKEKHVVVLPYLIFNGKLLERLEQQVAEAGANFYCGERLGAEESVCQVVAENGIRVLNSIQ